MSSVVLNYHRTEGEPRREDIHVIADDELDAQLAVVADSGLQVRPPASLLNHDALGRSAHAIVITFDDGSSSDLRNAHKLAARGYAAAFFVSTAHIGDAGYMGWPELRELRSLGMLVGSHAHTHVPMTRWSAQEATNELTRSRAILADHLGEEITHLAWPGGVYTKALQELAVEAGYRALWTTQWGVFDELEPRSALAIRRNNVVQGMTPAAFQALITGRSGARRRAAHNGLELLKRSLGERAYQRLRALAMRVGGLAR